jgi:hypothetical protein
MTTTGHTTLSGTSATQPAFNFWREVRRAYGFPLTMFALAIIPGLNFTYSGHGGPSWLLLPLCAPYILFRALIKIIKSPNEMSSVLLKFFASTIPCYVALAYPLSWVATMSLHYTFGSTIPVWTFMAIMISPFPYWYFS